MCLSTLSDRDDVVFQSGRKHALVHFLAHDHADGPKHFPKPVEPAALKADIPTLCVLVHIV